MAALAFGARAYIVNSSSFPLDLNEWVVGIQKGITLLDCGEELAQERTITERPLRR
jgi:hypothetical protein